MADLSDEALRKVYDDVHCWRGPTAAIRAVAEYAALAAQREELERLCNGLCYFLGKAFADGFFSDEPALQERVRLWVLERAEAMDDDLTIGQVVEAILRDDARSPLPAAPATEKEKP